MPGAGLEPARGFPQGILSREPSPGTNLSPSERRRKNPLRSARFRITPVTTTVTTGGMPPAADSHERLSTGAVSRIGGDPTPAHGVQSPGMTLGDAISAAAGSGAGRSNEASHEAAWGNRSEDRAGGGVPPLGKHTEKLSQAARSRSERREARYDLRDVLQQVTSIPRLCICGVRRIDGRQCPEIRRQPEADGSMVAHFAHVMLCGRV